MLFSFVIPQNSFFKIFLTYLHILPTDLTKKFPFCLLYKKNVLCKTRAQYQHNHIVKQFYRMHKTQAGSHHIGMTYDKSREKDMLDSTNDINYGVKFLLTY